VNELAYAVPRRLYVDFYEAAGRVKWSLFPSVRFHFRRRLLGAVEDAFVHSQTARRYYQQRIQEVNELL